MINKGVLATHRPEGNSFTRKIPDGKLGTLFDILVVFTPLLIFGFVGEWLGDSTAQSSWQ